MPNIFERNLEHIEKHPTPDEEESFNMEDLILMERELIKESEEEPRDWIEENANDFREVAPKILKECGGNKEIAKEEIKKALLNKKTIH